MLVGLHTAGKQLYISSTLCYISCQLCAVQQAFKIVYYIHYGTMVLSSTSVQECSLYTPWHYGSQFNKRSRLFTIYTMALWFSVQQAFKIVYYIYHGTMVLSSTSVQDCLLYTPWHYGSQFNKRLRLFTIYTMALWFSAVIILWNLMCT